MVIRDKQGAPLHNETLTHDQQFPMFLTASKLRAFHDMYMSLEPCVPARLAAIHPTQLNRLWIRGWYTRMLRAWWELRPWSHYRGWPTERMTLYWLECRPWR